MKENKLEQYKDKFDEYMLLGACLEETQKIEYELYGIAAHISKGLQDKPLFKSLTPEDFLRGDLSSQKATLGQLKNALGDILKIKSSELDDFVSKRNILVHNFWRYGNCKVPDDYKIENPKEFLLEFFKESQKWNRICQGCLNFLIGEVAKNQNRLNEVDIKLEFIEEYMALVKNNIEAEKAALPSV